MNRALIVSLPLLQRAAAVFFPATGSHRRLPGQLVDTQFRFCEPCGVETAVIVHGDGSTSCTENHAVTEGDPT